MKRSGWLREAIRHVQSMGPSKCPVWVLVTVLLLGRPAMLPRRVVGSKPPSEPTRSGRARGRTGVEGLSA